MNDSRPSSRFDQWLVAGLFLLAGLALLIVFVKFAEPTHRKHRAPYEGTYSEAQLRERLTATNLDARIAQIAAASVQPGERQVGRATGSPGFYRTEKLITAAFQNAGLQLQTQAFDVVMPETEKCEILGANGQPLPDVQLYPVEPAGLVPLVLPAEGITAELVAAESSALHLLTGHNPRATILLTAISDQVNWLTSASAGVRAIIVREDEVEKSQRANPDKPAEWEKLFSGTEITYPRFVARGPIEKYAGQPITIRCKVTWQPKTVRNLIGVLPGKGTTHEALVVTAYYDASSMIPELAPGAEESLSVAALTEFAQALAPYRGQLDRDVVFIATAGHAQGMSGVGQLMEAVETFTQARSESRSLTQQHADQAQRLEYTRQAVALCDQMAAGKPWQLTDPKFADWFRAAFKLVAGEVNLDKRNKMLAAKLAYIRAGKPVFRTGFNNAQATDQDRANPENTHPLLQTYIAAQTDDNTAANLMGLTVEELVKRPEFSKWHYLDKAREVWAAREAYHQAQLAQLTDSMAVKKIFSGYERTLTLNLDLCSGGLNGTPDLALAAGLTKPGTIVEPQVSDLANAILAKASFRVIHWGSQDATGSREYPSLINANYGEGEAAIWFRCGRLAFSAVNAFFYPPKVGTPEDTWDGLKTGVLHQQVPALGRAILALASGQVLLKQVPPIPNGLYTVNGTVLGNAGAASVVPSHRMATRTFMRAYTSPLETYHRTLSRGIQLATVLPVNPYGEFYHQFTPDLSAWSSAFKAMAIRFDAQGQPEYINDTSASSQSLFNSQSISPKEAVATGPHPAKPINLSMFRCAPVTLYGRINPQTMQAFKEVAYMDNLGLSSPLRYNLIGSGFSPGVGLPAVTAFLEPDLTFYVALRDGAANNPELLTDRAFLLNVDWRAPIHPGESEAEGRGYLAADTSVLTLPEFDAAASILRTNEKRLQLQKRFGMADEQMLSFHNQGQAWLTDAHHLLQSNDTASAINSAGASFAYAINNHPVIRARVSQAVVGILWYLGLLVPFVFFTEKLVCGFTDIRKQLVASGVIFIIVFALLQQFHPAFQMVRSSLMILLGFVILLLTFLVTLMVAGKFKQNLKDLRSKEGRVEGADVNRGGVIGTAFMLGLNNMRRRKVRTGLTCATLVLITFVMICFTSVSTDLANVEQPTGRSTWNGLMIRDPNFQPLDANQEGNIRQMYDTRYPVTVHRWLVADAAAANGGVKNAEILIDREYTVGDAKLVKRSRVSGAVQMESNEPLFTGVDRLLKTKKGWFPRPPSTRTERLEARRTGYKAKNLVILPDTLARELEISPADVDQGPVIIKIRNAEYEVQGIIDAAELAKVQGLDGQSILPYDLNSVQNFGTTAAGGAVIPTDAGRLPAAQVVLVNSLPPQAPGDHPIAAACMVGFPKTKYLLKADQKEAFPALDYRTQRRLVLSYLERIGKPAYYAIDGVAYYGSRQRATSFAGLLELLVPIIIAALTVFSTMRGSVYERRSEIYVYNAVGIAPNHVFFMFMAEACVYAVVGAVLGYILSQGTGRLLTALNFTGGLNMDYSSIETIYASLAIMGSVLLSTIIPARDAARLAAPSEIKSWAVPTAAGDEMTFNLPFTFTAHDRVAVISYFQRWLDSNGAGSSGPFFCSPPAAQLLAGAELVPAVASTVWLKPYDLGVSQRMEISLPTDPETGEYIARITLTRLSGHQAGWHRTLRPFLGALRKQFLNWRATTDTERREMFADASRILTEAVAKEETHA